MRNGWLDVTTIVSATTYHRRSYVGRYSGFSNDLTGARPSLPWCRAHIHPRVSPVRATTSAKHFDREHRPQGALERGRHERLAQHILRQRVPERRHDHALVEGKVVVRHYLSVDVHRVAEPPGGIDIEGALE